MTDISEISEAEIFLKCFSELGSIGNGIPCSMIVPKKLFEKMQYKLYEEKQSNVHEKDLMYMPHPKNFKYFSPFGIVDFIKEKDDTDNS